MFRGLPLPCSFASASPERGFAPEWKVTLRELDRRTLERTDQRAEARIQADKSQYQQQFTAQFSKTESRAEGAFKPAKVTRFKTPFCVNNSQRVMGCKGYAPCPPEASSTPAGGIFNLFSFLLAKPKP